MFAIFVLELQNRSLPTQKLSGNQNPSNAVALSFSILHLVILCTKTKINMPSIEAEEKKITRASFTDALYSSGGDLWLNAKKKIRRPNLYLAFALWASPGNKDPTPEQGFAFVTGLIIKRYFSQQFETCLPRLPIELARPFCLFLQNPRVQQPYLLVCFWYDRFSLFFQDRFCVFLLTVHTLHDGSIGTSMPL